MALVRVYLTTYRRQGLLPRALNSLLRQTFQDWVCELHNDDPADSFPEELVRKTADPRISLVTHEVNYGPVRAFNTFFKPIAEPYLSVLEDDNWWEPRLLETLYCEMERHPEVSVSWANQRFWQEQADGTWQDTGRDIWQTKEDDPPKILEWPQPRHFLNAMHSVGAMLARSAAVRECFVPASTAFSATEAYRERMFPFPIMLVPQRLSNFALTRTSARPGDIDVETMSQALLAGSSFVDADDAQLRQAWKLVAYTWRRRSTHALFYAAWFFPDCRRLLRFAGIWDWLFFLAYTIKHPRRTLRVWTLQKERVEEKEFLLRHTRARVEERRRREMCTP